MTSEKAVRMIPRSHAREIAELCVDVSEKAHYWKARAKAAEAEVRRLTQLEQAA